MVRADLRDEDWRGPCCIARDVTRPARLVQRVVRLQGHDAELRERRSCLRVMLGPWQDVRHVVELHKGKATFL